MNIYLFKSYYNQAIETAKCASLKNDRPLFEARAIVVDMCAGLLYRPNISTIVIFITSYTYLSRHVLQFFDLKANWLIQIVWEGVDIGYCEKYLGFTKSHHAWYQ